MPNLKREEYFPWYEESSAKTPQKRYLNIDFLKSERKRIKEAQEWRQEYQSADHGEKVDDLTAYTIPLDISKILKGKWNSRGYRIKGTSAIRNNLQNPILALFPEDLDLPLDYSLVRFIEPRKKILHGKSNKGKYAIEVEDYETLPDDYLYVDVPTEERLVHDILKKNLGGNEFIAESLSSPILSSPPVINSPSGVGTSSITATTPFAKELNLQIGKMLPREYTSINPPKTDQRGTWERNGKGRGEMVKYKTAERTSMSDSRVGLNRGRSYRTIRQETEKRANFNGEYSYLGNVVPKGGNKREVFRDALERFTQSDITMSSFNRIKQAEVDLRSLEEDIPNYEDLWINIVEAREIKPGIRDFSRDNWIEKLEKDWDVFLPQMGYDDNLREMKRVKAEQSIENILRVAHANARNERRRVVTEDDIKKAHINFKTQVEKFIDRDATKDAKKYIENWDLSGKQETLRAILTSKPCTEEELWERIKNTGRFSDKNRFIDYLRRAKSEGYIRRRTDGKLNWV